MDRHQFLIRAGAIVGQLLVPRFFDRALAFVENHDEPLLEIPRDAARHLAVSWQEDGVYWITEGPMATEFPPPITWREFSDQPGLGLEWVMEGWELKPSQLDQPMNKWFWEEHWCRQLSPHGLAWDYLDQLDLGPAFGNHAEAGGEIRFIDGSMPGSDSRWVEVDDLLSVSLLQNRFNELDESTSLEIRDSLY